MEKLRFGIIGIGNMGSSHALRLDKGEITNATLTAVCDTKPARLDWAKENLSDRVERFDSDESFLPTRR